MMIRRIRYHNNDIRVILYQISNTIDSMVITGILPLQLLLPVLVVGTGSDVVDIDSLLELLRDIITVYIRYYR